MVTKGTATEFEAVPRVHAPTDHLQMFALWSGRWGLLTIPSIFVLVTKVGSSFWPSHYRPMRKIGFFKKYGPYQVEIPQSIYF